MKKLNFLFVFFLLALFACEKVQYEEKAMPVALPVDVQTVNQNNNIKVTWTAPAEAGDYSVVLNYDGQEYTVLNNPTEYTFVNPKVNIEHAITVKIKTVDGRVSEGVTTHITIQGPNPVTNFSGMRDGNDIVLSWTLPQINTATSLELTYNDVVVPLASTATTYRVLNTAGDKKFTFGLRTKTAAAASHYEYATVNSLKFAFVTTYNDIASLRSQGDDDEVAAANWFLNNYSTGEVVSLNSIKDGSVNLNDYSVVWIAIDRVGTGTVPQDFENSTVLSKIMNYYVTGGNLLLTTHATQYISDLGRCSRKPGIIGAGGGGIGTDTWTINANIGGIYNHNSDPLFAGMTSSADFFPNSGPTFPLIGPGQREDHNSMWDLNSYGYSIPAAGPNVVKAFETENNATVMATWGHVTDFCCAGIVYFHPTVSYKGKCICIGVAAYEWNQNTNVNLYQSNIEKLTKNAIDILK
ncbi:DUF4960 domain-containing protein [Parabacteroides sp. FAFU027]|uniref:DUF4960 domain-containing protein n=1 Tax=Parabacteroides sp. FAFU027 TaxID=2922715 RepID=UPI001FAFB53D|nr:DUF4960 domain-containing protein [Parabacteroides sp. FAFU027]